MAEDVNPFPEGGVRPLWTSIGQTKPSDAWFDEKAADNTIDFFSTHLRHTQGKLEGDPFILSPEQTWVTRELFGWKKPDGNRLYRTCYVETGRGNGKSQWGAGIAGKLLFADGEASAEITCAGVDRDQAGIVLNRLGAMVMKSPQLRKRARVMKRRIDVPKTGGWARPISRDAKGAWGGAPHGVFFDDIHAQKDRELWDAVVTGTGKREQPLVFGMTTAGWDKHSLAFELHEYTRQIDEGLISDPSFCGVVWAAADEDDWTDPEVWARANPHMGIAFERSFLETECEKARSLPTFQNTFRVMYLSQWVGQETRFFPMEVWDRNDEPIEPGKRTAFGGVDLSSTTDLSAFVVVSERDGKVDVDVKVYAPEDGLRERGRRDRVPYEVWAREGYLTTTSGATIDQNHIKSDVLAAADLYDLKDISYDKWQAYKVAGEMRDEGLTLVEVPQTWAGMSAATKELLRLLLDEKIRHGGHPILRWMADNTAAIQDHNGNVRPDRKRSRHRIDGIVALIMALDGLTRRGRVVKRESVYESRGLTLA